MRFVDFAFPENSWEQKINDILKYKVSNFAMGDDWIGKFDYLKDYCNVIYLARTEGISSSLIKKELSSLPL